MNTVNFSKIEFNIGSMADVMYFFILLNNLDLAWHPDNPFQDYINRETGKPTFTSSEAENLNRAMEQAFDICSKAKVDIYEMCIDMTIQPWKHGDLPEFPNGFECWIETYHEIATAIAKQLAWEDEKQTPSIITEIHSEGGTGAIWDLARQWTNEFEKLHKGQQWEQYDDSSFFEEIELFIDHKIHGFNPDPVIQTLVNKIKKPY